MLRYKAKLIKLDTEIEELGIFIINGIRLVCFISYVDFQLELGKEYLVELNYQIFDEYKIKLADETDEIGFININNSFNYYIIGYFKDDILSINSIRFIDEYLLTDFTFFEKKKIILFVDRLEISILE